MTAALCDLKPIEFWDMTYLEFNTWVKATNKKQKNQVQNEMQNIISQAWYNAYYGKCFKKLPDLKEELKRVSDSSEEQTDEKLFIKVQGLQQKMGGVR